MRQVILTGGTDFIGSHLAERLLDKGFKVILVKRSFSNLWRINHIDSENLFFI